LPAVVAAEDLPTAGAAAALAQVCFLSSGVAGPAVVAWGAANIRVADGGRNKRLVLAHVLSMPLAFT